jgi:endo-1,4-beta-D-glucanase Y
VCADLVEFITSDREQGAPAAWDEAEAAKSWHDGHALDLAQQAARVRLGARGSVYAARGRASWLILGRKSSLIEVELQLERSDPARDNLLHITVLMRPVDRRAGEDEEWRKLTSERFAAAYVPEDSVYEQLIDEPPSR